MTHGSLFSGIGGFDLAAEWMGWENVFHCEWNPFGQRILNYYWPNSIQYHDITKTDFTIHRGAIDIITGGFPCQPYSMAGKRLGKNDERHLWPHMLRAIQEIQPRWVVGENVLGLVNWNGGLVFDEVQADLENQGYEVQPYVLPSASVGAPHKRDRVWFVAYAHNKGGSSGLGQVQKENGKVSEWNDHAEFSNAGFQSDAPNTMSIRLQHSEVGAEVGRGQKEMGRKGSEFTHAAEANGKTEDASDTAGACSGRELQQRSREGEFGGCDCESAKNNQWKDFPTQPPVCGGNDGLPTELDGITFSKWRNESIKGYGNAIVPQVVYQIFKSIELYETRH